MPIYEYQCDACQHHLEMLQKISDGPVRKCPSCGRLKLRRLISPPVFRLKGSGWYETDFKSDRENKRNLAEKDEPLLPADSGDKSSDKSDGEKKASTSVSKPAARRPAAPGRKKAAARAGKRKVAARR